MSLSSHISIGAKIGFGMGLVYSSYSSAVVHRLKREGYLDSDWEIAKYPPEDITLLFSPFLGAGAGSGFYGLKKSIQLLNISPGTVKAVAIAVFGMGAAHALGWKYTIRIQRAGDSEY